MRTTVSALLVSTLVLSACGGFRDSRANPFNWFGRSEPAPVAVAEGDENTLIPTRTGLFSSNRPRDVYLGQPIDTVSDLVIERVPGGAIIRATGVAATQGIYDVRLTPANEDEAVVDGVLAYRLEGLRSGGTPQGAPVTREVFVARKVTDQTLTGARTIRVEGARNALQARR
ncbi:hypothetical protein [Roseobacter sinensis]|uniref:Lipoprotein n=1 Tax=Roseobacter sinensis TaxID=2931391 RepID=A0ABT3BEH7_9RHOB|nr:hypothetical protein [Roseobacter sp. WL0113]MCV3271965.1 hypothetical protein [Roseobacter sp. WL0113]